MRAIQSHANNTWQLEVAFNAGNFVAETDEVRLRDLNEVGRLLRRQFTATQNPRDD